MVGNTKNQDMNPDFMPMGDVLAQMVPLFIPTYQRGFAWEQSEIDDFIGDINEIYESSLLNGHRKHFFGGIITIHHSAPKTKHRVKYEIVDGQQRLATFALTVSILVRAYSEIAVEAKKSNDEQASKLANLEMEELRDTYIIDYQIDRQKNEKVPFPRLELSEGDDAYFQSLLHDTVKRPPRTAAQSNKRLYKAWQLIKENLVYNLLDVDISFSEKLERIKALADSILFSCYVIFIWSSSSDDAYQLFTVLNDRGKSLSNGDLLRAHTLQLLKGHPNLQKHVKDHWDVLLRPATRHVEGLLAAYYPSVLGERSRKPDIFPDYKKSVFEELAAPLSQSDAIKVETIVKGLCNEQINYMDIINHKWPYEATKLSAWHHGRVKRLVGSLRHNLCIPLLM